MTQISEQSNFLHQMGVTQEEFFNSKIEINILQDIASDYEENYLTLLDEAEYIAKKIQRCDAVHSVRWRIKSTSHLIKKIIRKLNEENPSEKYQKINVTNYKSTITDLIGVRAIYLFKSNWKDLHNHILSKWTLKKDEDVIIYHRDGDDMSIYEESENCKQEKHVHNYRSIHYVIPVTQIQSQQIYCEIQTRTIFEEGWSEIDHKVRYPDFSEDQNLMRYLTIFNRLAGSADEMASYVNELVALIVANETTERERKEQEENFLQKTEKLQEEITSAKNKNDANAIYKKLVEIQQQEIDTLKIQLQNQSNERIRLHRAEKTPMVTNVKQKNITTESNNFTGEIEIEVTRPNKLATFTGHFDPPFTYLPSVTVELISTTAENTNINDIKVNTGVGKPSDFNVHLTNDKLGNVIEGTYKFKFSAK